MGFFDFLKPSWQTRNQEKALKTVAKEEDQQKLAEIARNAPLFVVSRAAFQKLSDQGVLAEIAKNFLNNGPTLLLVVERLTDQQVLGDIAQSNCAEYVRVAALDKLTDSALAHKIFSEIIKKAKKSNNSSIRLDAVRFLSTQSLLAVLAKDDPDFGVREAAAGKLTDQETLTQIAKFDTHLVVREAAVKNMTDRALAQEILDKIKATRSYEFPTTNSAATASFDHNEHLTYNEFVDSIKSYMNIREYDKVKVAIGNLTNRNILSEIVNSGDARWCYDRGSDNYGPYHIVDLRDTARSRLGDLGKGKVPTNTRTQIKAPKNSSGTADIQSTLAGLDPNKKPNSDLYFIADSLKNVQTMAIKGLIDGLVVMTPTFAKTIQKFPTNADRLYQIGLRSLMGIEALDLIRNPSHPINTQYYGTLVIHSGFPQVCLKCGKPMEKFELLMAPVFNEEGIKGRVSMTAENSQEIFDVLMNVRHFMAVPCCAEHSIANRFFFWMGTYPFFTDDQDIAATCRKSLNLDQVLEQPVKVVNGEIVY